MANLKSEIEVILFDLGGVLVELTGVPTMLEWSRNRFEVDELWEAWLNSPSVRTFERGQSTPDQFARELISEMQLSVDPDEFIKAFTFWPKGLYPGVIGLLRVLRDKFKLACLSNTNELHWPRLMNEMKLADKFAHHFASHQTGFLKPDRKTFEHVLQVLDCPAANILFFDDNELNVQTAKVVGMKAETVKGFEEVKYFLENTGLTY